MDRRMSRLDVCVKREDTFVDFLIPVRICFRGVARGHTTNHTYAPRDHSPEKRIDALHDARDRYTIRE
jgi:hypothetical protein